MNDLTETYELKFKLNNIEMTISLFVLLVSLIILPLLFHNNLCAINLALFIVFTLGLNLVLTSILFLSAGFTNLVKIFLNISIAFYFLLFITNILTNSNRYTADNKMIFNTIQISVVWLYSFVVIFKGYSLQKHVSYNFNINEKFKTLNNIKTVESNNTNSTSKNSSIKNTQAKLKNIEKGKMAQLNEQRDNFKNVDLTNLLDQIDENGKT